MARKNEKLKRFPADRVYRFVKDVLDKVTPKAKIAELTARGLWMTSLRGVDSHGVRLLPHYVKGAQKGRINPDPDFRFSKTSASTGTFDADHSFGHAAGINAMQEAISLARESGSGFVAVKNSSHCGAMAYFALQACREDMIGLAFTHATSKMRTANSKEVYFGTNPICFAAPMMSEGPFCFDAAPTPITSNKINQYREDDHPLPPHCAADKNGNETQDPHLAEQLLPIGDYKGYGWAMMVDVLCGLLSDMPTGLSISKMFIDPMSQKRYLGQFYGVINIAKFVEVERFKERLQNMADEIRKLARMNANIPVQIPGDPEKVLEAERRKKGIPIKPFDLKAFNDLAEHFEISPLVK